MDVGRVQPGLAAVLAGPPGTRPDEPDAGAGRVVVHRVRGGVQLVNVGPGEELRGGVRSLGDADLPVRDDGGPATGGTARGSERRVVRSPGDGRSRGPAVCAGSPGREGDGGVVVPSPGDGSPGPALCGFPREGGCRGIPPERGSTGGRPPGDIQHVAGAQGAAGVAAEAAEGERRRAAQVRGHVEAAADREVGAQPGAGDRAEVEHSPGGHGDRFPERDRGTVEGRSADGAGEADDGGLGEPQARAGRGALQGRQRPAGCRRRGWPRAARPRPSGRSAGRRPASTRAARASPARSSARPAPARRCAARGRARRREPPRREWRSSGRPGGRRAGTAPTAAGRGWSSRRRRGCARARRPARRAPRRGTSRGR